MSSAVRTQGAASRHAGSVTERTTVETLQMSQKKSVVRRKCEVSDREGKLFGGKQY